MKIIDINDATRRNRKRRKASGIYKLESFFRETDKETLSVQGKTYYINGNLSGYLIVSVPETTTRASAMTLEQELSKVAKKPVLLVTHNMAFLRATILTTEERAELTKLIDRATADQAKACESAQDANPAD